jgi:hypothetical protein
LLSRHLPCAPVRGPLSAASSAVVIPAAFDRSPRRAFIRGRRWLYSTKRGERRLCMKKSERCQAQILRRFPSRKPWQRARARQLEAAILDEIKQACLHRLVSYRRALHYAASAELPSSLYACLIRADLWEKRRQRVRLLLMPLFCLLPLGVYIVLWQLLWHQMVAWYPHADAATLPLIAQLAGAAFLIGPPYSCRQPDTWWTGHSLPGRRRRPPAGSAAPCGAALPSPSAGAGNSLEKLSERAFGIAIRPRVLSAGKRREASGQRGTKPLRTEIMVLQCARSSVSQGPLLPSALREPGALLQEDEGQTLCARRIPPGPPAVTRAMALPP